jgi:uncharacterized protein (DUF433 family)
VVDAVFTSEQVMRLTGVSRRRLDYWLDRGVVSADVDAARGRGRVRLWSFANLIEVRIALALRDEVSLQLLGKIVGKLRQRGLAAPLAEVRVTVLPDDGRVLVQEGDGGWTEPLSGQFVLLLSLPLDQYAAEITEAVARDRKVQRQPGQVVRHRGRLGSKEVFAGTRVPVAAVKRMLTAGWTSERILAEYPGLTAADISVVRKKSA